MLFLYQIFGWHRYAPEQKPKMAVKKFFIFCLLLILAANGTAQDMQLSQQYAGRLFLNPAFAGAQADMNATMSYRRQWPGLSGGFTTNQLSGDYRFNNQGSALGLAILTDKVGASGLARLNLNAIYAYHLQVGEDLTFSGALQGTYGSQRVDFGALLFGDQFSGDGRVQNPSAEVNFHDPVSYLSVSAGGLLYSNSFWVGLAAFHMNQPDIGFATLSELPVRLVANGGYKFSFSSYYEDNRLQEFSITPTITYMQQGEFHKTELALYTTYTPMTLGVLYRGFSPGPSLGFDQSVAAIVGFALKSFKVGYSYDLTLAGIGAQTGGSHELSLRFEKVDYEKILKKRQSRKNYNQIACPAF
jgi:type IX secretion system PorP/SprF family membrane protein